MDDTPIDLNEKSAASNAESRLSSTEKDQEGGEDLRPTPNGSVSNDAKELSESAQNGEKLVKQDNMESRSSFETNRRHTFPKSSDEILESYGTSSREMSDKAANNSAKRHNTLNSTFGMNKPNLPQASELIPQSSNKKTAEKCIYPGLSTSVNAVSSPDYPDFQGHFYFLGHTRDNQYECRPCNRWFDYEQNLEIHALVHLEKPSFQCGVCGKVFSQAEYLNKHEQIHMGRRPFRCPICSKGFRRKQNLRYHKVKCVTRARK